MQRVTILLLGITLVLLIACNTQKPTVITQKGLDSKDTSQFSFNGKSDSSTVIILSEAESAESYLLASIKRTGCYGKCPVYEAKVFSNGTVLYEGKQFSAREGIYEAYLTQNQIDSLLIQADSAHFFDLQPLYPTDGAKILDLPSTFTYLKKDKAEKEIINNHSAPKSLKYFEQYFDQLLLQLDWKPVEEVH